MGQGLSRNSPVQLSLGRDNYEALIERHGQWIRWRVAAKCPCIKPNSMQPDIHCRKCGGLGITYGYQDKAAAIQTVMVKDSTGIIELDAKYRNCALQKCYDNAGKVYANATKTDNYILLNDAAPVKGVYVTAVMTDNVLKELNDVECHAVGNGFFRVEGLRVSRTNIEGLYHDAPGDIEEIEGITDFEGHVFYAREIRQDCILVDPIEVEENGEKMLLFPPETLKIKTVKYIPPFVFVILNQNLSKSDAQVMQELNGDGVLTFPYDFDVSNDDVLTVLSGTYTVKSIIEKKEAEYDVIPAYFVESVVNCTGKEREYLPGVDFILCGTNYIKWLCDDCPEDGEAYSITYRVNPTYKVVKAIPQIRTSENQRMPKKAVVKLYDTYGEARGVNRK